MSFSTRMCYAEEIEKNNDTGKGLKKNNNRVRCDFIRVCVSWKRAKKEKEKSNTKRKGRNAPE